MDMILGKSILQKVLLICSNICFGYKLELSRRGNSKVYLQHMFFSIIDYFTMSFCLK